MEKTVGFEERKTSGVWGEGWGTRLILKCSWQNSGGCEELWSGPWQEQPVLRTGKGNFPCAAENFEPLCYHFMCGRICQGRKADYCRYCRAGGSPLWVWDQLWWAQNSWERDFLAALCRWGWKCFLCFILGPAWHKFSWISRCWAKWDSFTFWNLLVGGAWTWDWDVDGSTDLAEHLEPTKC